MREAKARLSKLLQDVRRGKEWVITDRGKPVARLTGVSGDRLSLDDRIKRLEDLGLLEPRRIPAPELPSPLPLQKGLAQRWLQEDRNR